ncbi:MAG: hypothetical protein RI957_1131, partial [Verrucomicrobiota bacterium]
MEFARPDERVMGKNVSFKLWGVGIKDHPEGGNTAQQVLESSERPEGAD